MLKNKSFSFKLVLLFFLTGIAMMIVLRFTSGGVFMKHFEALLQPHFQHYFHYVNTDIGTPPNLDVAQQLSEKLNIRIIIKGPDLHWSSDGQFPKNNENRRHHRRLAVRITNAPYSTLFITKKNSEIPSPWKLLLGTLLGILSVLGLLYYLLQRMISPLKTIQQGVKRIGTGEFDHRIHLNRKDELGELSQEINAMADDIQNMLEAKRQMLLAISHELRSPITRAKVATSLLEDNKLKTALESDLNEMEAMVSGLLEAEQLNNRHHALQLTTVDINPLITDVIRQYFPNKNISFIKDDSLGSQSIDDARLRFTIKNLLDNALKYRKQNNDEIIITTQHGKTSWQIMIEDQGIGIPQQHLAHLTEPFYRVDPSRHRETGGYGLGLYIIKMIIEAHQGTIDIQSVENEGTTVTVVLPL